MPKKRTAENEIVVPAAAAPARRRKSAPRTRATRTVEVVETPAVVSEEVVVVATTGANPVSTPTYEEIAKLAYSLWEARGCQGGSPEEDWCRAEEQLRSAPLTMKA